LSLIVAGVSLGVWLTQTKTPNLQPRLPGGDGAPAASEGKGAVKNLEGQFQQFDGVPSDLPGAWPKFHGPDGDNICKDTTRLADVWPDSGPPVLWQVALGEGHAAPVVLSGRVYVLDYDEQAKADAIRCFSLTDGKEIWRRSYTVSVKRNHGMSRTIPAVTDKYLVTMGPRCHVACLDSAAGTFRWGMDLQQEYGTTEPLWYTGQCPLIENNRVILAPCGPDTLMMAVDCETGQPVWKTPNPKGWNMSHSSIVPMTIAGKRMYVYCAVGGVTGVSAEDADAGTILWQWPWTAKVIAPSPVPLEDGRIFVTAGYGEGGVMIQVREGGGTYTVEVLYEHGPKDGLACEQQTPIYFDELIYSVMPKDAGALREQFVCYRPDGTLLWSSGASHRFGLGPFVLADGKFYILNDDGLLTMARVSKDKFEVLSQARILQGPDAWGPIALAGERMLLRDSKTMVCIAAGPAK
jgi:outer membrane protein assembly factor BamB